MRKVSSWAVVLLLVATASRPPVASGACSPGGPSADAPMVLVLSGGGAKGAYEAGVALAFVARGIPIRLVAGTSAGALNAAMLADGRVARLEGLWRTISREQVYALRAPVVLAGLLPGWLALRALDGAPALFDGEPLRALITRALDLGRVRSSPVRILVVTSDLARREKRLFDNRTVTVDALLGAAAVPGAFAPVEVDGSLLVDGGLTGRAPVLDALAAGVPAARAVVVMSYAPAERSEPPRTIRPALEEAFEMAMIHQIRRDTELARLRHPEVDVQLLVPSAPLALRPLEFDAAGIARAFDQGRADGMACVAAWEDRGR